MKTIKVSGMPKVLGLIPSSIQTNQKKPTKSSSIATEMGVDHHMSNVDYSVSLCYFIFCHHLPLSVRMSWQFCEPLIKLDVRKRFKLDSVGMK